jgi:hypothetical protein
VVFETVGQQQEAYLRKVALFIQRHWLVFLTTNKTLNMNGDREDDESYDNASLANGESSESEDDKDCQILDIGIVVLSS